MDSIPHTALRDDEKLHKNILLRLFHLGEHIREHRFPRRVVGRLCIGIHREVAVIPQIGRRAPGARVSLFKRRLRRRLRRAHRPDAGAGAFQLAAQPQGGPVVAPKQVEQPALHRHYHKQHHPADLDFGRRCVLPDQRRAHDHTDDNSDKSQPLGILGQLVKQKEEPDRLQKQQQAGDHQPAEDKLQHALDLGSKFGNHSGSFLHSGEGATASPFR